LPVLFSFTSTGKVASKFATSGIEEGAIVDQTCNWENFMIFPRLLFIGMAMLATTAALRAQENPTKPSGPQEPPMPHLQPGTARKAPNSTPVQPTAPQVVPLTVPRETSLQVALDKEVKVKRVGQPVSARLIDPIYAFDKLVVPAGSEVRGAFTKIEPVSTSERTLAGLNADFTPVRRVEVTFSDLVLPDGKHMPLHTSVMPGSGQVLQFVSSSQKDSKKSVKDMASEKTEEAKKQARTEWDSAMKQLKTPGKLHRIERYAEERMPVHGQYIPAGTVYFAELQDPLSFGTETLPAEKALSVGGMLPPGTVVHARLLTALSSATAQKGEEVEAVLSRPLFDGDHLLYPQGSRLVGSVGQVRPAGRFKRNGQLRVSFHEVQLPDGIEQKVQAALVAVQAGKDGNVKLDSEGGAEATTSKTRYASLGVALGLAAIGSSDRDGDGGGPAVTAGNSRGFRLVGIAVNAAARSRALGYATGAYGAGRSLYQNFLSRGHEVVFPKNTAMDIGVGTRVSVNEPPMSADARASAAGGH
jgi:type IV secretory pathway VirB10-like protein